MTAAAIVVVVGAAVAVVAAIVTVRAARAAFRVNKASRETYANCYSVLEEAAKLAHDAQELTDGITSGALRG